MLKVLHKERDTNFQLKHKDKKKDTDKEDRITIKPEIDPIDRPDQPTDTTTDPPTYKYNSIMDMIFYNNLSTPQRMNLPGWYFVSILLPPGKTRDFRTQPSVGLRESTSNIENYKIAQSQASGSNAACSKPV